MDDGYGVRAFRDSGSEKARQSHLQDFLDPITHSLLAALAVGPGWRCLEVGAGGGTIARHLDSVGADTVGLDRDLQMALDGPESGVVWLKGDVTAGWPDDSIEPSFDLIHARRVLMHLPQRREVLRRLTSWLRPGGWLVVGENADIGVHSPNAAYRRALSAQMKAATATIGTDYEFGWRLPAEMSSLDLGDIDFQVAVPTLYGGGGIAGFVVATMHELADRMQDHGVDEAVLNSAREWLADPATVDTWTAFVYARGRKPS